MVNVNKYWESGDKAERNLKVLGAEACTDSYLCLLSGGKKFWKRAECEVVPVLNKAPCSKVLWQVEVWVHALLALVLDGKLLPHVLAD